MILPIVLTDFIVPIFMTRSIMTIGPLVIIHSTRVIMVVLTPITPMAGAGEILITTAIIHPLHGDLADTWAMACMIPTIMDITMDITTVTMAVITAMVADIMTRIT